MLKKAVRLGILLMLVISFMFGVTGIQKAKAIASPTIEVYVLYYPEIWNGSYDYSTYETWQNMTLEFYPIDVDADITFGMLQAELSAQHGTSLLMFSYKCESWPPPFIDMFQPSPSAKVTDYPSCGKYGEDYLVVLFNAGSQVDITRLTLYGYIKEDGKSSCTLWSLDGTKNIRPNEKCGADVELVCTVRLVDKELKYECEDGYNWLGFNIAHDPKWLSWADKFAERYGR